MNKQVMELMESVQECLVIVIGESSEIANDFQTGNTGRANQKLIGYIEKMSCLVEAIEMVRSNDTSIMANLEIGGLQQNLVEMEQAMRSQDYVLLADILEYEIKEILVEIQGQVK